MSEEARLEIIGRTTANELYDLHDRVQVEFVKQLKSSSGAKARAHLQDERKLPQDLIDKFGLGYIPNGPAAMRDLIVSMKVSLERAADAGLLKRDARRTTDAFKKSYKRPPESNSELSNFFLTKCKEDRFFYRDYHCIVPEEQGLGALFGDWLAIPIYIETSTGKRIGGFQLRSARPVAEIGKQGRYRNPINTAAMTWNETLIGLAEEAANIEKTGEVIICEGGFDRFATIAALETKYKNTQRPAVIALGGIAVRGGAKSDGNAAERAGILSKIKAKRSILLLDQDEKGTEAILIVGPRLSAMGQFVSVCRIEDGWKGEASPVPKDAGELWQKGGAPKVLDVLDAGRNRGLITYAANEIEKTLASARYGGRAWERLKALDILLPILETVPLTVRDKAIGRAAEVVALPEAIISRLVAQNEAKTPRTAELGKEEAGVQAKI